MLQITLHIPCNQLMQQRFCFVAEPRECEEDETKEIDCNLCHCLQGKWACSRNTCVEKRGKCTNPDVIYLRLCVFFWEIPTHTHDWSSLFLNLLIFFLQQPFVRQERVTSTGATRVPVALMVALQGAL